jgi:L-ascorbate metabolism protein UlaG (beta-lactamase superfamily)
MDIRYLGHSAFQLTDGSSSILVDPFLTGNPKAAAKADEIEATAILLTHGHSDHGPADAVDIAKRTGAPVLAIVELAHELSEEGVEVFDPNLGGTVKFDWGWVKLVPAWHTAVTDKGTPHTPAGLLINVGGTLVYHLGDTCLFSDLELVARRGDPVDVALIPIGGHYTMDRWDAVEAANLIGARQVIPCHYGTFPLLETDAEAFKADVEASTSSDVVILAPGDTHSVAR